MKIAFIAHDQAPSKVFELLVPRLVWLGHLARGIIEGCRCFIDTNHFTNNSSDRGDIEKIVAWADVIMVGMSSSIETAWMEIDAIIFAKKNGKKVFVFADMHEVAFRPFFKPHLVGTTLCVIDEHEKEKIKKLLPDVPVVNTGNPVFEERISSRSNIDRKSVRDKLKLSGNTILYAGLKELHLNIGGLYYIIDSVVTFKCYVKHIIFVLHPQEPRKNLEHYESLRKEIKGGPVDLRVFDSEDEVTHLELLEASDVFISRASGLSNISVHWGKPTIDLFTYPGERRYESQTGSTKCFLADNSITYRVEGNTSKLARAISQLLVIDSEALKRQRQNYQNFFSKNQENSTVSIEKLIRLFL